MGVDVSSIMAFGTEDESSGEVIAKLLGQEDKNGDTLQYYITGDIPEIHIKDLTPEQQEIVNDFMGFELWENMYNGDFEGFGVQVKPNSLSDEEKNEVIELFKKYNLDEPEWVAFSHWW